MSGATGPVYSRDLWHPSIFIYDIYLFAGPKMNLNFILCVKRRVLGNTADWNFRATEGNSTATAR